MLCATLEKAPTEMSLETFEVRVPAHVAFCMFIMHSVFTMLYCAFSKTS